MDPNIINMSNFSSINPDEEFICPFDPIHKVIAKRFPYHVMKCRKNWNGRSMLTCIFNARHIIPASEHRHHIKNCPDRAGIEADISYAQRKQGMHGSAGHNTKGCTALPTYDRAPSPTEDWDEEVSAEPRTSYNPADYPGPSSFQNLAGYSAGEKREFHRDIGTANYRNQQNVEHADTAAIGGQANSMMAAAQPSFGHVESANSIGRRAEDNSSPLSCVQPESTASPKDKHMASAPPPGFEAPNQQPGASTVRPPPGFATNSQLRLPKQPARAAPSNRGGRIAANIFMNPDQQAPSDIQQPTGNPSSVATPAANNELGAWQRPLSIQQQRPPAGIGRGLVQSGGGLGRGMVPGIGRGLTRSDRN